MYIIGRYSRVVFHGDDSKRLSMRLSSRSIRSTIDEELSRQRLSGRDLISLPSHQQPQQPASLLDAIREKEEEMRLKRQQEAPFQQLDFLVRDWQNFTDEDDLEGCLREIDSYKDTFFTERTAEDLKTTRDQINNCFQKIGVFLLPNPGKEVMRKTYNGDIHAVDKNFLVLLGFYIEHIFQTCLMPKVINKEVLNAEDFEAYDNEYMNNH